jgi:hypothetical protein
MKPAEADCTCSPPKAAEAEGWSSEPETAQTPEAATNSDYGTVTAQTPEAAAMRRVEDCSGCRLPKPAEAGVTGEAAA